MGTTAAPAAAGGFRTTLKRGLARATGSVPGEGATYLIYHRIGGGTADELDVATADFTAQLDLLADLPPGRVVSIDEATDRLAAGRRTPSTVLTFDDGFSDVYERAWPLLKERGLPFTVYLASGHVGGEMRWEGSTAKGPAAPGLGWAQLREMADSGLCTVANHTRTHARPVLLTTAELDGCNDDVEEHLGARPRHFAYTWGVPVPHMAVALRARFRTAATGEVGRNLPGSDPARFCRVPVRRTDPIDFFRAKLYGRLVPERAYARIVAAAKAVGARA
ncbi:polysaccharide deacetylase family protein [Kitasatospora sp. NPDC085879]|jgi:peptidoglycan/xylan/chitin deacetylase (PgdA/CDA1 family)|uniref:polysaccharide deacetylase family protein n=1 Tax=Kitasatospora sp. NPDC085879 TaxID=3154769 RepID=UPI000BB10D9C|nr:polysaccharide deacetylase family protein [Streptomyces sp. TLI_235]PBC71363.1 polysaccharide deacetylase [Streptomyces sp. TLI_235]